MDKLTAAKISTVKENPFKFWVLLIAKDRLKKNRINGGPVMAVLPEM